MGVSAATKRKVILIDDSELVRELVRAVLEGAGYQVLTLDSGLGASATIMREQPDLVLVDLSMPALSGDKLAALIKQGGRARSTAVAIFSDRPVAELEAAVRSSGADGYIPKTLEEDELPRNVRRFLERYELDLARRGG